MNYQQKWNHLFNKFADMFPLVAEMAVDGYVSGRYEITVILNDGGQAVYDGMSDTARFRRSDADLLTETDWMTEFSTRLKKRMRQAGMNQAMLSEEAGVSQKSVSNYLAGKTLPNAYALMRIARALEVSVAELCEF